MKLFHDDTMMSFARRPDFSPDGELLFVPGYNLWNLLERSGETYKQSFPFKLAVLSRESTVSVPHMSSVAILSTSNNQYKFVAGIQLGSFQASSGYSLTRETNYRSTVLPGFIRADG